MPNRDVIDMLNRASPAHAHAQLGTLLNSLVSAHNALLAKLDADGALNDADYVDTLRLPTVQEHFR